MRCGITLIPLTRSWTDSAGGYKACHGQGHEYISVQFCSQKPGSHCLDSVTDGHFPCYRWANLYRPLNFSVVIVAQSDRVDIYVEPTERRELDT